MEEIKLSQVCAWVDAAYGVQPNTKSNTVGGMLFGYGIVYCKCIKKIGYKIFY